MSQGATSGFSLPVSIRRSSMMSSTYERRCSPAAEILPAYSPIFAGVWFPGIRTSAAKPRMALRGVRMSWLTLARKAFFVWFISSALTFRRSISASRRRRMP